jgi:multidrug efflux pump subunit AcrB
MILFIVIGLLSLNAMPQEEAPEISLNWVNITTIYQGASAEEMENLVAIKQEDALAELDHIETMSSWSGEGYTSISVKYEDMSDEEFKREYQELVTEIGNVDIPDGAEKPKFFKWSSSTFLPVLSIAVYGDVDDRILKDVSKQVKRKFSTLKEISKVELSGERDKEIWLEIDPQKLFSLGLSFQEILTAVQQNNISVTAGSIKQGKNEFVLRSKGELKTKEDILNVIIKQSSLATLRLGDIAKTKETLKKATSISRFNGKPAITVRLFKKPGYGTIDVIHKINDLIEIEKNKIPEGIFIESSGDISHRIEEGIGVLSSNALAGVILVLFLLHLFLGTRNAVFAAIGIPTSFLITFIFLYFTDQTMNLNVMFGMVLVLGMIVDDAMVIIENVYRYLEKGETLVQSVLKGVPEVAKPVMASIFTTIAAFLPLMLMPGIIGKFMRIIPFVVTLSLVASIIEAFFLMPVHIVHFGKEKKISPLGDKWIGKLRKFYDLFLQNALKGRWYLLLFVVFLFFIGIGMISNEVAYGLAPLMIIIWLLVALITFLRGRFSKRFMFPILAVVGIGSFVMMNKTINIEMFADEPLNMIFMRVKAPHGTNLDETKKILLEFEKRALNLPKHEFRNVITNIGILNLDTEVLSGSNVGEIIIDVAPKVEQNVENYRSIHEMIAELQNECKDIQGVEWSAILFPSSGPPAGKPVEVKILGKDFTVLRQIADELKEFLKTIKGPINIEDDFVEGKEEFVFNPNEYQLSKYGLNSMMVGTQLYKMVSGEPIGVIRENDEEITLRLKYPEDYYKNKSDVQSIRVTNMMGQKIPLNKLGTFESERNLSVIKRFKRQRTITVSSELEDNVGSIDVNNKIAKFFESIEHKYPGYRISFEGEFKEFATAFDGLVTLFFIGIGLMFIILGTQFKSWLRPIMILLTVPVAFVGATFGLAISGNPFSIGSLFGMVALAGVAVNSAIVLVDFISLGRKEGRSIFDAVLNAGHIRFRPIILTSLTTIFGMLPLALGIGGESVSWQPLAITIVFGLGVSTLLTLFLIPAFYIILEDFLDFYHSSSLFRLIYRGFFILITLALFFSSSLIFGIIILIIGFLTAFIVDLEKHDRKILDI